MQFCEADLLNRDAIDEDLPFCRRIKPQKQTQDRGFSRTGLPGNADPVPFFDDIIKMLQDIFLCARISKGYIPELNGLDLTAGNRMLRFPGLRFCIFNFKDTFCRRIALQQARHHKSQTESGGQRSRCRKGQGNGSHRMIDAAGCQHAGAHQNQDSCQVHEKVREGCYGLAMQSQSQSRLIHLPIGLFHHLHAALSRAENLDIPNAVDTLQNLGFQISQLFPIAHADATASL